MRSREALVGFLRADHPVAVLALAFAGFLAGIGLLHIGTGHGSAAFRDTPGFWVWAVTIGAQTAYWLLAAGPTWENLLRVWRRADIGRSVTVILALLLGIVIVGLPWVSVAQRIPWPLEGHQWKVRVLTTVGGLLVAVPAVSGIAMIHERIRHRRAQPIGSDDPSALIEARADVLRFLSVAGTVIGLAVLASGALHRATAEAGFVPGDAFPGEAVLLYGAFFTALLALVFVPAHLSMKRFACQVLDHHFDVEGMPPPNSEAMKEWLERRAAFGDFLKVNSSGVQQLEASLFIFAPLLSAIVAALVP